MIMIIMIMIIMRSSINNSNSDRSSTVVIIIISSQSDSPCSDTLLDDRTSNSAESRASERVEFSVALYRALCDLLAYCTRRGGRGRGEERRGWSREGEGRGGRPAPACLRVRLRQDLTSKGRSPPRRRQRPRSLFSTRRMLACESCRFVKWLQRW